MIVPERRSHIFYFAAGLDSMLRNKMNKLQGLPYTPYNSKYKSSFVDTALLTFRSLNIQLKYWH